MPAQVFSEFSPRTLVSKKYTPSLLERDPRAFHGIVGNIRLDIPTHDLCEVSFRLFRMLLNDAEFTQIKVMIERKLEKFLELSQLNNYFRSWHRAFSLTKNTNNPQNFPRSARVSFFQGFFLFSISRDARARANANTRIKCTSPKTETSCGGSAR